VCACAPRATLTAVADPIVIDSIPIASPTIRAKVAAFIAPGKVANSFEAVGTLAALEFANGDFFEVRSRKYSTC
jgi:hypothetical protein